MTAQLPQGTLTFLFTDIEGSTRLWEQHPEAMRGAVARHEALITAAVSPGFAAASFNATMLGTSRNSFSKVAELILRPVRMGMS